MLWSYLINSNYINKKNSLIPITLTFEQVNSVDFKSLALGYCDLIIENFFDSFTSDYDTIYISEYSPTLEPFYKDKLFIIKFNNKTKAHEYITNNIMT